ncbi:MAG: hypothetical protein ABJF11_13435 [Reichenbachiella sp.]|uniref:hypothetical protein n=1 Tax=Reichenbachiella sp. TaxID=2184521 RepID=UPI003264BF2A
MSFSTNHVDIESVRRGDGHCLQFKFKGRFTEAASIEACQHWNELMEQNPVKHTLIWDCIEMEGFEIAAKNQWSKSLKLNSNHISTVVVISHNPVIRGAARLMLKLFSFDSKVVRSHNQLEESYELVV